MARGESGGLLKFAGQLKFPDVDHPGIPATFVVEDTQAELLIDGESLGRWSLFDVEASRLVASAFQVILDGEEITFLADDPIDFAYRGVEHMAEAWARIKALALPRRRVAVRKSRKGTTVSRLEELRGAVFENLQEAPARLPAARDVARHAAPPPSPRPEPQPVSRSVIDEPVEESQPTEPPIPEPDRSAMDELAVEAETQARPALLPGPGLVQSLGRAKTGAEDGGEPQEAEDLEPIPDPVQEVEPPRKAAEPADDVVAPPEQIEPEEIPEQIEPEEIPEQVKELIGTPAGSDEGLFVDLGRYEEPEDDTGTDDEGPLGDGEVLPGSDLEPVLVGTTPERSGLFGAVRSAFVRNRIPHEHQFVDAPGGMGITRQICTDCGHISIRSED